MTVTMPIASRLVRRRLPLAAAAALAATLALIGCGGQDKAATQTAARVNKEEITVHQINFVLQQQRNLRPEQAEAASKQILERLIDQELAVQKADDQKLDRDPRVVQQMEAARREILARAYIEKVGEAAAKPTPKKSRSTTTRSPRSSRNAASTASRKSPSRPSPSRWPNCVKSSAAKNINEFVEYLKAAGYRFAGNQAVRAAEQLPLNSLDAFSRMKDGQAAMVPAANGVQVVVLAGSRSQPVSEEQARPAIEQYLLNERKRKLIEDDRKAMRTSPPRSNTWASLAKVPRRCLSALQQPAHRPSAAASAASAGLSAGDISKGMGLK
jgi:EpsD family peptidyl-prolyl cis-trans isomerase